MSSDRPEVIETVGPARGVSRRRFMQGLGATALAGGAVAAAPDDLSPVGDARAIAPVVIGGIVVAGAVLGYLVNEAVDYYTGDDPGQLTGEEETATKHAEIYQRFGSMANADATVEAMTANRLEDAMNVAWAKSKKAAVVTLDGGGTQAEALTAAKEANAAYYAQVQKNLIGHWNQQMTKIEATFSLIDGDASLDYSTIFDWPFNAYNSASGAGDPYEGGSGENMMDAGTTTIATETRTLVDGSEYTGVKYFVDQGTSWSTYPAARIDGYTAGVNSNGSAYDFGHLMVLPPDTGSNVTYFRDDPDPEDFHHPLGTLWDDLVAQETTMRSNIDTFVADLYAAYEPGDIDPAQFLDPITIASELSTDYDSTGHHSFAAAEAAVLGLPTDLQHAMKIDLETAGITVDGAIWTDWAPDDTDGDGNADGFTVGTTYDPSNTSDPVYLSYEYGGESYIDGSNVFVKQSDGTWQKDTSVTSQSALDAISAETLQSGFQTLEEPFTIASATNTKTGETTTTVTPESKNYQTADVTLTYEQLMQLVEMRNEMQDSDTGSSSGGGGIDFSGWSLGGIPGEVVALVAAGGAAFLIGGRDQDK